MRNRYLILLATMGGFGLLACSPKRLDEGAAGASGALAGSGGGALAGSGGGQAGAANAGAAGSIMPSGTGGTAASGVGGNAAGGSGTGGSAGAIGSGGAAGQAGAGGATGGNGLSVNPSTATFDNTLVEAVSAPRTFTVRNEADTASVVASLQGTDAADFLITSNGCGTTLQPSASCDITVAFAPRTRSGLRGARLTVGAPSGTAASASLNGLALPALGLLAGGNATGAPVRLNFPIGIASDRAGKAYITDYNAIREVDIATGTVTTIAGVVDQFGAADGIGGDARFKTPNGIASDGAGNLYVADTGNETIRKVVIATGAVTTVAGLAGGGATGQYGYCGYADGTGAGARFCSPCGIASDGAGNLYVADIGGTIRKIVIATAAVTTLAGSGGSYAVSADGRGADARFATPIGITSDGAGSLYVAEFGSNTIRKVVIATGDVTTLAGTPGQSGSADGMGTAARFLGPFGIAGDGAGNLYVTDSGNYTIRKVVIATGAVTTIAGVPSAGVGGARVDGTGDAARFFSPHGVASDGAGHLYVADSENNNVRQVVIATARVTTIAGAGRPEIADGTGAAARFNNPAGITSDGADNLYVADTADSAIRKVVVATGAVATIAGAGWFGSADGIGAAALFNHPEGVACDRAGNVYVADTGNNTIRKIALASGAVTTIAGAVGQFGSVDGTGAAARFSGPTGLTSDGAGILYVADTANSIIRKIVIATGVVTTIAGAGTPGSADGTGAAARFSYPYGVAFGWGGNLYVADTGNSTIRKIVIETGAVTTLVGKAGEIGNGGGTGSAARFTYPYGIAGGGAGILYVADTGSSTIRTISIEEVFVYTVIPGAVPALLNAPYGLALLPTGELAITDFAQNAVLIGHL